MLLKMLLISLEPLQVILLQFPRLTENPPIEPLALIADETLGIDADPKPLLICSPINCEGTIPIEFPLEIEVPLDVQLDPAFNGLTGMLVEGELPSRTPMLDIELVCGG